MALERLYYNDPFSNIVISTKILYHGKIDNIESSIKYAVENYEPLGQSIALSQNGELKYKFIGFETNVNNIYFSNEDDKSIVKFLMQHSFNLTNADSFKVIIKKDRDGIFCLFFCLHHIIGDANSLLLIIDTVFNKLFDGRDTAYRCSISKPICIGENNLSTQSKYLISTIESRCSKKNYSFEEYSNMFHTLYENNELDVFQIILNDCELSQLIAKSKELGVSVTAYIASALFEKMNVDLICMPIDTRIEKMDFGNYVSRIDVLRKDAYDSTSFSKTALKINEKIKSYKNNSEEQLKNELLLSTINPLFFDDVIYDAYTERNIPYARKMAEMIGYKTGKQKTSFISNLRTISFSITNLDTIKSVAFYPPPTLERISTIGIVTFNNQMIITIQKFRKDTEK